MVRVGIAIDYGNGLDAVTSARFGRAPAFLIIDVEPDGRVSVVKMLRNTALSYGSGVGVRVSKMLADEGCKAVAGPAFGPNAAALLSSLGIRMIAVPPGVRVRDVIGLIIDQLTGRAPPPPTTYPPPWGRGGRGFGRRRFRHGQQGF